MNVEQIRNMLLGFFRALFPENIWNWDYFTGLWERYANVEGFFTGILIIVIVYFASDRDGGTSKKGMIRVFALVALINAIDGVYLITMNLVNQLIFHSPSTIFEQQIKGAFNQLSIMVLVMVITECYRNHAFRAFFFGLSTFVVNILMFGSGYADGIVLINLFVRVLLAGALCAICTRITYNFINFLTMGFYFVISEATHIYLLYRSNYGGQISFKEDAISILSTYKIEYIIIGVVVVVLALFEVFILSERKTQIVLGSIKLLAFVVLTVLTSGVMIYFGCFNESVAATNDEAVMYSYEVVRVNDIKSSSFLVSKKGNKYPASNMIDNKLETSWQDGKKGNGVGESINLYFEDSLINKICIANGNNLSEKKYYENCRLCEIEVVFYRKGEKADRQVLSFKDAYTQGYTEFMLANYVQCDQIGITASKVYQGSKYKDLCVAEISLEKAIK